MTDEPHMLVSAEDAILICTLNRPNKLNALSRETLETFEAALQKFRDTPELKVLLLRATGRYFSAGADLREGSGEGAMLPDNGSALREMHRLGLNGMHRIYDEMEHIEKPIVVAHQAMCVGGGLEISLSCDFRLAAKSAGYAFPEGKMGTIPASNGISRLTRIVGTHWARYLVMANLPASAEKALIMGLVHEVYPDESFEVDVMNFCRHLSKQHSEQMGTAKIAIEIARDLGPDMARHVERMADASLMLSPEFRAVQQRHIETIGASKS